MSTAAYPSRQLKLSDTTAFQARYDEFLSSTGLADAVTLGKRFGVDIHSVDFWRASLDVIRGQIEVFEGLVR